jgi:hypothetical protein
MYKRKIGGEREMTRGESRRFEFLGRVGVEANMKFKDYEESRRVQLPFVDGMRT